MASSSERRVFPRRPFDAAVFTYESGARFVAHPVDLSLGGAFLATEAVDRIAVGDLVSVVFGPEAHTEPPVFLFAKVVRRQRGSSKGVGVQWVKAVTTGTPEHLAAFVARLFGVRAESAQGQVGAGEGRFRALFSFDPLQQAARRHRETVDAVLAGPDPGELRTHRVRATAGPGAKGHLAPGAVAAGHAHPAAADVGVITSELTVRNGRAPFELPATLRLDRRLLDVRLVEIGCASVEIVTGEPLALSPQPVSLGVTIPVRDAPAAVRIEGRMERVRPIVGCKGVSIDLKLVSVDEGTTPGVWGRFARWCYFQSLSQSER